MGRREGRWGCTCGPSGGAKGSRGPPRKRQSSAVALVGNDCSGSGSWGASDGTAGGEAGGERERSSAGLVST
eukprot:scaffold2541_cov122-Isochrysis_galbana.AAC.3